MEGIKTFSKEASACVRVDREFSESFPVVVGMRHGCLISLWIDVLNMKATMRKVSTQLKTNTVGWAAAHRFADNTMLLAKSERELQRVVDEFYIICTIKVKAWKTKEG